MSAAQHNVTLSAPVGPSGIAVATCSECDYAFAVAAPDGHLRDLSRRTIISSGRRGVVHRYVDPDALAGSW